MKENTEHKGLELYFDGKPSTDILDILKNSGLSLSTLRNTMNFSTTKRDLKLSRACLNSRFWPQEGGWLPLLYYAGFIPFALLAVALCITLTKNWRI